MTGRPAMEYRLSVNGFEICARYETETIENVFYPLLKKWTDMQKAKDGRLIVFLAAPPAVGKSTLGALLERLSRGSEALKRAIVPVQALGLDGFHHHQDYILSHDVIWNGERVPMKSIKGAPESFDIDKLQKALENVDECNLRWPFYDRRQHDVVENAIGVDAPILLIEGNWLLLDEPKWRDLKCDYSLFITAGAHQLRQRLIDRKMRGGLSLEDAGAFYEMCDGPNVQRCLAHRRSADLNLALLENDGYGLLK